MLLKGFIMGLTIGGLVIGVIMLLGAGVFIAKHSLHKFHG